MQQIEFRPTKYYPEFIRYYALAKKQQELCNVSRSHPYGALSHTDPAAKIGDDLMEHVELYDVVQRKYAGFSQIVNDIFYGWHDSHPYWEKMKLGKVTKQRNTIARNWSNVAHDDYIWLWLFILHRVTGSAINYSTKPTGYHNTVLPYLYQFDSIKDMNAFIKNYPGTFYTSIGYQFPAFPKPAEGYKRGGDFYLAEYAPELAAALAEFLLYTKGKKSLREVGNFMLRWNVEHGLRQYHFQYAAVVADIADWFPDCVYKESHFYYGTNAKECISYLAERPKGVKEIDFLDNVMDQIMKDTGGYPYDAEDCACDFIRWIENYVRPGADYDHLDFDSIWNSSTIIDHPFGRQKKMLEMGLVKTFNGMKSHPSDDFVLKSAGMSVQQYKEAINVT